MCHFLDLAGEDQSSPVPSSKMGRNFRAAILVLTTPRLGSHINKRLIHMHLSSSKIKFSFLPSFFTFSVGQNVRTENERKQKNVSYILSFTFFSLIENIQSVLILLLIHHLLNCTKSHLVSSEN